MKPDPNEDPNEPIDFAEEPIFLKFGMIKAYGWLVGLSFYKPLIFCLALMTCSAVGDLQMRYF
jgi:hypothetical protein